MSVRSAQLVVLDALPQSAAVVDTDSRILHVNRAWECFSITNGGGARDDIGTRYLDLCDPGAADALEQAIAGIAARHVYACHAPGRPRWFELQASPMDDGQVLVVHHEVTDSVRLRRRFDVLDAAFVDVNTRAELLEVSGRWSELSGLSCEESVGVGWLRIFDADDRHELEASLRVEPSVGAPPINVTAQVVGQDRWVQAAFAPDHDEQLWIGWNATVTDVSARVRSQVKAATDDLTGLFNREIFCEIVGEWLCEDDEMALLFIDADDFKEINDQFGHAIGDLVLQTIARRLRGVTREMDVVGRFGGDEFVIGIRQIDGSNVGAYARRVEVALERPLHVNGHTLVIGASVGYAVRARLDDCSALLERADRSMYERKAERKRASESA